MSEEKNLPQPDSDPLELWRRWYEAGIGSWPGPSQDGNGAYDPYGLYQQWLSGLKDLGQQMGTTSNDEEDRYEYWQRLMDATAESWRRALGLTPVMAGVAPRWAEMVGEFWQQMLGQSGPPVDPLDFYQRCYKALNGPLSEIATETLENDSFLEYSRQAFRYYTTLDRMFGRLAEEYFGRLHLSTSSESTRIAGFVVAVDERIDRLEDALEDADYGREGVATGSDMHDLKDRLERVEDRLGQLDRVEEKLDRLLGSAEVSSNGGGREIKATDAARRKAQELGVDLAAVEGTGAATGASEWLAQKEVLAVGADNMAWDVIGEKDSELGCTLPGHLVLIARYGIYIIENLMLDELAAAGHYRFQLVCIPLKLVGATGSPVRPIAVVSGEAPGLSD